MLKEASELWDEEKLIEVWKKTIKKYSHNPIMWIEYINFMQTAFSSFTVSSIREIYVSG